MVASCGCVFEVGTRADKFVTGSRLTLVQEDVGRSNGGDKLHLWQCDCGARVEASAYVVAGGNRKWCKEYHCKYRVAAKRAMGKALGALRKPKKPSLTAALADGLQLSKKREAEQKPFTRKKEGRLQLLFQGKWYTIRGFAQKIGVQQQVVRGRLGLGWNPDQMANIPTGMGNNTKEGLNKLVMQVAELQAKLAVYEKEAQRSRVKAVVPIETNDQQRARLVERNIEWLRTLGYSI